MRVKIELNRIKKELDAVIESAPAGGLRELFDQLMEYVRQRKRTTIKEIFGACLILSETREGAYDLAEKKTGYSSRYIRDIIAKRRGI